jgi:chromosome segregation ATPase
MDMELEDLVKRIDWLEKEHRKDHATIIDLQEKLAESQGVAALLRENLKTIETSITRVTSATARLDQFDTLVGQYRVEFNKSIEEMDKRREKNEREQENRRRTELDNINRSFIEVRSSIDAMQDLRKGIQARVDEDIRLSRSLVELSRRIDEFGHVDEDLQRSIRTVDEARRNDYKRTADLQGELAAIRKRIEEAREKADLAADSFRMIDTRVNEIMASENDRKQAQKVFIEQQNLATVDRDRAWKEMQQRFESFTRQTSVLDQQIATLDEMQRSVKRSQEAFEDMNTRMERRLKEITEVQRLAEDRFRQEWVTFKADDQKRWTNFTLTQDEVFKDIRADLEKVTERIADIDEVTQVLKDLLEQTTETTETQMQELMNWSHEWLTNSERIMGRSRTK